jgi:cytochrome subunit of sulfide dehydrogenase
LAALHLVDDMAISRTLTGVAALIAFPSTAFAGSPEPPPGASSCSGCHVVGRRVDTAVPPLIGRTATDLVAQMHAFKDGQKPGTIMDRIVRGFSDAEIQAIADWYAQQK